MNDTYNPILLNQVSQSIGCKIMVIKVYRMEVGQRKINTII